MSKKITQLVCLCSFFLICAITIVTDGSIDYSSLLHALKIAVPACIVIHFGTLRIVQIFKMSKVDTNILETDTQKQYIDDLLLTPEQVLNNENSDEEDKDAEDKEETSKVKG